MLARDAECLAEPARPAAEEPWVVEPAPLAHRVETVRRLERAHEHRVRDALVLADEVQAPVDPVRAVDVRVAGRAEHRGVPLGTAAEAVARRVLVVVGLDLDDPPADPVDEQRHADQRGRDLVDAAGEEASAWSARVVADEGGDGKGDHEGTDDAGEAAGDDREAHARQRRDEARPRRCRAPASPRPARTRCRRRGRGAGPASPSRGSSPRRTALTLSAAPAAASRSRASQSVSAKPKSRDRHAPQRGRDRHDQALPAHVR